MQEDIKEILLTKEQIAAGVARLGKEINADYQGKVPLLVAVLKGAVVFLSDLIRAIEIPVRFDFMAVSSYGPSTQTTGQVQILKDLGQSIEGQHVIVVEDIIDTGLTLRYILENLSSRKPASLKICTFLDKPSRREVDLKPDYNGYDIPDEFVVGYGLDFAEQYRNLPYIGVLKREKYNLK